MIHLMPSPYKTKCFDYNKIGCKSRRNCVDRCNIDWALKHCNGSLPSRTIIDRHNDKDTFKDECNDNYKEYCQQKYKSPDCINQYYKIKLVTEKNIKELAIDKIIYKYFNKTTFKSKLNINLMSSLQIEFNNDPETIYTHLPQQYPIEFICFTGGVISLWTGFSVLSLYAFGKRIINRKQNKIEAIKVNVNSVNNKKIASINKKNDKISSLKNVLKTVKILKKKNQVIKVTPNNIA